MTFVSNKYVEPNFNQDFLIKAPDVKLEKVTVKGVAPQGYHALSIYPEYFKINGVWKLAPESRMDTVAIVDENDDLHIVEFRKLNIGDRVIIGRSEDASEGIYLYTEGFNILQSEGDKFSFRTGRSRETGFSKDYDELYEILKKERENNGHIVWVLGPSVSYDDRSRNNLEKLIEAGFVNAIITGNSAAVVDLARGLKSGDFKERDNRYYIDSIGEYDTVREIRQLGGIEESVKCGAIKDGYMKALIDKNIPYVLAGSIRDRYNLEEVIQNVYEAQDAMRSHTRRATMLICLSSVLNTIASGNMTPSYTQHNGEIRPVYIYSVDLQEFSVNKLSDRGTLEVKTLVTNVHDFLENLKSNLV